MQNWNSNSPWKLFPMFLKWVERIPYSTAQIQVMQEAPKERISMTERARIQCLYQVYENTLLTLNKYITIPNAAKAAGVHLQLVTLCSILEEGRTKLSPPAWNDTHLKIVHHFLGFVGSKQNDLAIFEFRCYCYQTLRSLFLEMPSEEDSSSHYRQTETKNWRGGCSWISVESYRWIYRLARRIYKQ